MVDDALLSRETAYMYQYITGFHPVDGNLTHWQGMVADTTGRKAELEIHIPEGFPYDPPALELKGTTTHPRAGSDGKIITRTIQNWSPSNHIYTVVREAKSILGSGEFSKTKQSVDHDQAGVLENQVATLRQQLQSKKQTYQKLKQQTGQEVASSQDLDELIEDSLIEVENEAYALEEAYDNLEIKAIDFAMNFVDARKRYYLIESSK